MFEEFGEFVAELGYSGLSQELKDIGSDYKAGKMDYTIGRRSPTRLCLGGG